MSEAIQVVIGLQSEDGSGPMSFYVGDEGVNIHDCATPNDLELAAAVLRDLADALDLKRASLVN